MTERPFHPSGLTREPPAVASTTLPEAPEPTVYPNGRIGWPDVLQYGITGADGIEILSPVPPTEKTQRERLCLPRTQPYRLLVTNLEVYEVLFKSGALADPRHTGRSISEPVDKRPAPAA